MIHVAGEGSIPSDLMDQQHLLPNISVCKLIHV